VLDHFTPDPRPNSRERPNSTGNPTMAGRFETIPPGATAVVQGGGLLGPPLFRETEGCGNDNGSPLEIIEICRNGRSQMPEIHGPVKENGRYDAAAESTQEHRHRKGPAGQEIDEENHRVAVLRRSGHGKPGQVPGRPEDTGGDGAAEGPQDLLEPQR
jgi:hypothetical protein